MMKVRFGKKQVDCIYDRLVILCEGTGMDIFEETYNTDGKYDENGEPIFETIDSRYENNMEYTPKILREIYDNMGKAESLLYDVFCKDEYGSGKGATLDVSLFNTDGLRHAGYWVLEECVGEGSGWYDNNAHCSGFDDSLFKTEMEVIDFEYNLQDKVNNIDWGFENDTMV